MNKTVKEVYISMLDKNKGILNVINYDGEVMLLPGTNKPKININNLSKAVSNSPPISGTNSISIAIGRNTICYTGFRSPKWRVPTTMARMFLFKYCVKGIDWDI